MCSAASASGRKTLVGKGERAPAVRGRPPGTGGVRGGLLSRLLSAQELSHHPRPPGRPAAPRGLRHGAEGWTRDGPVAWAATVPRRGDLDQHGKPHPLPRRRGKGTNSRRLWQPKAWREWGLTESRGGLKVPPGNEPQHRSVTGCSAASPVAGGLARRPEGVNYGLASTCSACLDVRHRRAWSCTS